MNEDDCYSAAEFKALKAGTLSPSRLVHLKCGVCRDLLIYHNEGGTSDKTVTIKREDLIQLLMKLDAYHCEGRLEGPDAKLFKKIHLILYGKEVPWD